LGLFEVGFGNYYIGNIQICFLDIDKKLLILD
jgi:hypothetical protein